MRDRRLFHLLAVCVPLMWALGVCAPSRTQAASKAVANLTESTGDVTVVRASDGDEVDGEEDLDLFEGDTVKTAAKAKATIGFLDNHLVKLSERSSLVLRTVRVNPATGSLWGRVRLATGKLFASFTKLSGAQSGFSVETRTAVAAVKGTTFAVEEADDASTVSVLEGTVATAGLDERGNETEAVDVAEGQETSIDVKGRRPMKPRGWMKDARRSWIRPNLEGIRDMAARHRELKRSGELGKMRRMRNLARASYLLELKQTDPDALEGMPPGRRAHLEAFLEEHRADLEKNRAEVDQFLGKHPAMKQQLRGQAERRLKGRDGAKRGGKPQKAPRQRTRGGKRG